MRIENGLRVFGQRLVDADTIERAREASHRHTVIAIVTAGVCAALLLGGYLSRRLGRRRTPSPARLPSLWRILVAAAVLAVIILVAMARFGGPSAEALDLAAIRPGHRFAPGELPNAQFPDRSWEVASWSVVSAHRALRAGGAPCDAVGGVLRDAGRAAGERGATFTALAVICDGRVLEMPRPQEGSRVWLTPLDATPLGGGESFATTTKLEIRFVEAVALGESVVWASSMSSSTPDGGQPSALAIEQAFRETSAEALARPLVMVGIDTTLPGPDDRAAVASYHCAFEGDAFPKSFRCTSAGKSIVAEWNPSSQQWTSPP